MELRSTHLLRLLLIFALGLFGTNGFTQTATLKGLLTNDAGEALAAAPALLYAADSTLASAQLTDAEGQFVFRGVEAGTYRLDVSGVGYAKRSLPIEMIGSDLDMGKIALEALELDAVEITTERPLIRVEPDKTVFYVAGNLSTTGDQALELLRKAPGVTVDQNDDVMVEGKTGVQIYVDGRPLALQGEDRANYLKSLPADAIESVEIITQPSSRFDAAGNGGIINLVMAREKGMGTNGTASAGLIYGQRLRGNGSLALNHRRKKLNLFGNYSNRMGPSTNFIYLYRIQSGLVFDERTDSETDTRSHNVRTGADYQLNDRHTFGVLVNADLRDSDSEAESLTPISTLGNSTIDSILSAPNRSATQSINLATNLNYHFEDTLGTSVNVDLDYGHYNRDRDNFQPNYYFAPDGTTLLAQRITSQITPTTISIYTARADFEKKWGPGVFSTGVKFSAVDTDNAFEFYQEEGGEMNFDSSRSNQFRYLENVNAAYVNYKWSTGKWNMQGGLRAEHTHSIGELEAQTPQDNERVERNYLNLFPSGGVTYNLNWKNSFALLYSRRIQRPNYASLNPFEFQLNELSFSRGNPFLQPQYTDNVKLSHTYKYAVTTSISYSFVSDFFAKVTEAEGERRNFLNTRNVANQETYSFNLSAPIPINDWWSGYLSGWVYYSDFTATNSAFVSIDRTTYGLYAQSTFKLPKDLSLEVSGWYNSPSIWGGTYRTRSMGALNVSARKDLGPNWTLKMSLNDLLYTNPWRGITEYGGVFIDGTGGGDSRQVRLSLSYRFGHEDIKSARKRDMGLDDEAGRL